MQHEPAAEYRKRLELREAEHGRLSRLDARIAAGRLALFAVLVLVLGLAYVDILSYWAALVPAGVFIALVRHHDAVIRARDAAARSMGFYDRGLARIEDRWSGMGEPGERFRDDHHLYANDLDLFGRGSLFELLSTARTPAGERTLAGWLKQGAARDEVLSRQAAVSELAEAIDLREALAVAGVESPSGIHADALLTWAEAPRVMKPPPLRWVAALLTAALMAAVAVWINGDARLFVAVLIAQGLFVRPQRDRIAAALSGAEAAAHDLDILASLIERLEPQRFTSGRLRALHDRLATGEAAASARIRRLHRAIEMHEWQENLIFRVLSLPLLWRLHIAWMVDEWRSRHGRHVRVWMHAVGEIEALASLAAYCYEHPGDPFPEITAAPDGARPAACFEGTALGHPLLPKARMVPNDVQLGGGTHLLVVSGSNMSGKSTLLRTVGINAVMALAGAPVRAAALRISPLTIGATLRIQDSLQEGKSRFYAEITRIRDLADAAVGPVPLLFLLDELFHGTNSHDRLVGASGVLRGLLDRGAIGLITTHDLALTAIADELMPRAENVHFEDWFEGSEIRFDYRMKPGRLTRSNALALMRAVGLDVGRD